MTYTILNMNWSVSASGKKVEYDIAEIVATKMDETYHKVDSFHFIKKNESGYVKSTQHFDEAGKILIAAREDGWHAFVEWIGKDTNIVVWKKENELVVKYMNKLVGCKEFPKNIIFLEPAYVAMTSKTKDTRISLYNALEEMKLSCEKNRYNNMDYLNKCLVRLFRKLVVVGKQKVETTFIQYLHTNDTFHLSLNQYFPKIVKNDMKKEMQEYKKIVEDNGLTVKNRGYILLIETSYAKWVINMERGIDNVIYHTKQFYKGERSFPITTDRDKTKAQRLQEIIYAIKEKEKVMAYGIGSDELVKLVEKLCG